MLKSSMMKSGTQEKYLLTFHVRDKMRYYRLTEGRIKRIIRHPARVEEGILEGAMACMQPAGGKQYSEIWAMYLVPKINGEKRIKIITAWRYPGKSPARDPIPKRVLQEVRAILS